MFQTRSSAGTDGKPVPSSRPLRQCPICGQLRDSKNYTRHVKAHQRYPEGVVTRGRPRVKMCKNKKSSTVARAGRVSIQSHVSNQSWIIRRTARKIYPYLCIGAHVSTLREVARSETSVLPGPVAEAVITMGQAVMREVGRQFGAVSPEVISRAVRKRPDFHIPKVGGFNVPPPMDQTSSTSTDAVALIAIDNLRDELNTVEDMPVVIPREELKRKYSVKKSTGQVAKTPEVPTLCPSPHVMTAAVTTATAATTAVVATSSHSTVAWASADNRPRMHYTSADRGSERHPHSGRSEHGRAEGHYHRRDATHDTRQSSRSGHGGAHSDREHRHHRQGGHSHGDQFELAVAALRRVFGRDEGAGSYRR